ncbi:MAG: BCD family MFS transporter [Chloroflexota bacterium]
MRFLPALLRTLLTILRTLQLSLPRIGVGWMFAILTVNFNQIVIFDLKVAAVIVTSMIGLHYLLSPFQIIFGRIADRNPIFGFRRTPYMLVGATIASTVFLLLPGVATGMGAGSSLAFASGFALFIVFGVGIAAMGDSYHSLIAENVEAKRRGAVVSLAWTLMILSTIITAGVSAQLMPTYDAAAMQTLYNLTPLVVLGTSIIGVMGIERRLRGMEKQAAIERARTIVPDGNPIKAAISVLRSNPQVRLFFAFVFITILGIFLQDGILEVYGREVFGMEVGEASMFQQMWGGGVLIGMIGMGLLSVVLPISKKTIATVGGAGTALGFGLLTIATLSHQQGWLGASLFFMGLSVGLYNVGAVSLMMDMTVEGATGLYMGLWGVAQACGNGFANMIGGALKTVLIETGFVDFTIGYATIFGLEAVLMIVGVAILRSIDINEFRGLTNQNLTKAMEVGAAA